MKTKFELVAHHLAYGQMTFVIEAEDNRAAFRVWKQVVGRPNQWVVRSNAAAASRHNDSSATQVSDAGHRASRVDPEFEADFGG